MKILKFIICFAFAMLCIACGETAQVVKQSDLEKHLPGKWALVKYSEENGVMVDALTSEREVLTFPETFVFPETITVAQSFHTSVNPLVFKEMYDCSLDGKNIIEKIKSSSTVLRSTVGFITSDKLVLSVSKSMGENEGESVIKQYRSVKVDYANDVVGKWKCIDASDVEWVGLNLEMKVDGTCDWPFIWKSTEDTGIQEEFNASLANFYVVDGNLLVLRNNNGKLLSAFDLDMSDNGNTIKACSKTEAGEISITLQRI